MIKYTDIISKSKIFDNIKKEDIPNMLNCLSATEKSYKKGQYILRTGDVINSVYMVAEGKIHILKEDYWGNQSILGEAGEGELFGEAYACMGNVPVQVNATAVKDSVIIRLDINKVLTVCSSACEFHSRLIRNLISVIAERNLNLTNKLECMSQRTTRDKILSYLSMESQKNKSSKFDIPFNRQQLADFLSVDRSALSKEMCKMRDEGIFKFNKNHFELL